MRTPWTGVGTALVTPFTLTARWTTTPSAGWPDGRSMPASTFSCPCGTTGESPTLSEDERVRVVELIVDEANGKVPVLAGAGGYDTRDVIHTALRMKRAGARGILSVTPYYNKPTAEGLFQHYSAIAGEVGLPVVVYNVPGRTGLQRRCRDAGAPRERAGNCRRQRSVGKHCADGRDLRRRAA